VLVATLLGKVVTLCWGKCAFPPAAAHGVLARWVFRLTLISPARLPKPHQQPGAVSPRHPTTRPPRAPRQLAKHGSEGDPQVPKPEAGSSPAAWRAPTCGGDPGTWWGPRHPPSTQRRCCGSWSPPSDHTIYNKAAGLARTREVSSPTSRAPGFQNGDMITK